MSSAIFVLRLALWLTLWSVALCRSWLFWRALAAFCLKKQARAVVRYYNHCVTQRFGLGGCDAARMALASLSGVWRHFGNTLALGSALRLDGSVLRLLHVYQASCRNWPRPRLNVGRARAVAARRCGHTEQDTLEGRATDTPPRRPTAHGKYTSLVVVRRVAPRATEGRGRELLRAAHRWRQGRRRGLRRGLRRGRSRSSRRRGRLRRAHLCFS